MTINTMPKQKKSHMPLLGLGTYRLEDDKGLKAMERALEMGYRHLDTADVYHNHHLVAKAKRGYPRNELYLVTKLYENSLDPEGVAGHVQRFLNELETDYIDLLLIHWPNPKMPMHETLAMMVKEQEKGTVKYIGVSNFVRFHFDELEKYHLPIVNNQIEMHVYLQHPLLLEYSKKHGIPLTAYRPLARGALGDDPVLNQIGQKYGKSANQVGLRWLVEQDIAVIPKATSEEHLRENFDIFDFSLSEEDHERIKGLNHDKRYCNPTGLHVYED